MRRAPIVPLCVLALLPVVAQQQQQQPTFRAGVDVVAVDVHVVDGAGRPVPDLKPEEFAITVDDKPRPIVAADYVSHGFEARPTDAGTATLSEFVVFDPYVAEAGSPRPSVSATATERLTCCLEAYAGGQAPVEHTTPAVDVDELMPRVATYIQGYAERMSLVIGVERYSQWLQRDDFTNPGSGVSRAMPRHLVAEFALVRVGNDWDGFRNVYEVDGKAVADAKDRMAKLFTEKPASAVEQGRKIAAESSRYNMGAMQRNFNVPTVALFFLSAANQGRFRFTKDKADQVGGVRVWKVKYEETRRPTIIRTSSGKDMPVKGEAWIDPVDGRVLKTHMQIDSEMPVAPTPGAGGRGTSTPERVKTTASITVTYTLEPKLGILVPAEMLETYEAPMRSAFTGDDNMTKVNCRATYSDFKRFETSGRLVVPKK